MIKTSLWKRFTGSKLIIPLVTLALLLLYNLIFTQNFFAVEIREGHLYGNVIDILKGAAPIMLIAIGLTLVIATKGIDISVGSVMAISAAVVAFMIGGDMIMKNGVNIPISKVPLAIAIAIAIGISIIAGVWNGLLVSRVGMQPIIATLILMVAGRGIAMMVTQAQIITLYYTPFSFIGSGYLFGLPFSLYIVLVVLLVTLLLVRRTAMGLFIESVGANPIASRFAGIKAKNIIFWCYVFTSFCAGISGIIFCSNVMSADPNNAGLLMELDAILAVVLGGTSMNGGKFYLVGSMIGALIIRTLTTTIWAIGVPAQLVQVVKAIVIFIVCVIQSDKFRAMVSGIFGRKELAV